MGEVAKEILPFLKKIVGQVDTTPEAHPGQTVDGLPVSRRKCVIRACVKKDADGGCGAAVISCGGRDGSEPPAAARTKLHKKDALALAKHSMHNVLPVVHRAREQGKDDTSSVEEILEEVF